MNKKVFDNPHNGEFLYLLAFLIFVGGQTWGTTTFPQWTLVSSISKWFPMLLIGLKVMFFTGFQKNELIVLGVAGALAAMIYMRTGYQDPFFWIILVAGSKDVSLDDILKVYLVVAGTIVFLAFSSSLLMVIENYQYTIEDRGIRNSFGIIYATDFASHLFYLVLAFFYVKRDRLTLLHYIAVLCLTVFVYIFCKARLDSGCLLLIAVFFGFGQWAQQKRIHPSVRNWWGAVWHRIGSWILPFMVGLFILLSYCYQENQSIWTILNSFFNNRLSLGHTGLKRYGFSLFGQQINMVGMGGGQSAWAVRNYFFLDCSYLYIVLQYGVLFALAVLGIYVWSCFRRRNDIYFLYVIALIAINCAISHHMMEWQYNPFAVAWLAAGGAVYENMQPGQSIIHKRKKHDE